MVRALEGRTSSPLARDRAPLLTIQAVCYRGVLPDPGASGGWGRVRGRPRGLVRRVVRRPEGVVANLLFIDDDPGLMPEQVRQAFPAPRHRIGLARTGSAGLGYVRSDPPDVVLLGLQL